MSSEQPYLTMAEAARACGVSVSTMRRHRDALERLGATRHDASWQIPVSALIGAGLMPRVTPSDASRDTPSMGGDALHDAPSDTPLRAEIETLREQLRQAEQRAAVAEAEARERLVTIEAQRTALRLLEAAPSPSSQAPRAEEPQPTAHPEPRGLRAWLRRSPKPASR